MGQWFQRLRANAKYGAVNDATIQGYLRAASQLERVWQQIDDKVDELLLQGLPPWEAYTSMGYALAFVRACRMNVVFVQELLKSENVPDVANAGYLPKVTYDQALALSGYIEPTIEEAIKASTNSRYILPLSTLPLKLGPHIGSAYQSLPLSHVQGTTRAAQEMQEWTAGLLAKYELALQAAKLPLPREVSTHLEQMKSELELGDFHLRTGVDMAGQMSQGRAAEELNKKAEDFLWEAMESFYTVSQLVAMPDLHPRPAQHSTPAQHPAQAQAVPKPAQARPVPRPPEPPEPVALDLLNQVIAEPASPAKVSAQPSPDLPGLVGQVAANPQTHQREPPQPPAEIPGLLDQGVRKPEVRDNAHKFSPETSGSLAQNVSAPRERPRAHDTREPDFTGLLAQDQDTTPRERVRDNSIAERAPQKSEADDTLDLLSEICGKQPDK